MQHLQPISRRAFVAGLSAALGGCAIAQPPATAEDPATPATPTDVPEAADDRAEDVTLSLDMTAWSYDDEDDVWWQKEVAYCAHPAAREYESLAIYVPGPYLRGTPNDDGLTYTCALAADGARGTFTATTAPVLVPINGGSYAAELSPASYNYSGLEPYLETGFVYVYPGFRGRSNAYAADGHLAYEGGAPWSVVDLKAAIRFLRANAAVLPGDYNQVFAFGLGAGGTLANLLAASGDADFFEPYLTQIGAAEKTSAGRPVSDAVQGVASWVAECEMATADAAYEWALGQYVAGGSDAGTRAEGTWTCELSRDLARAWADEVNAAELVGDAGEPLAIEEGEGGICCAGSYYELLCSQLEAALNSFLATTRFPYAEGAMEYLDDGDFAGGDASSRAARAAENDHASFGESANYMITTYATPADYVTALNGDMGWVSYDAETAQAHVSALSGYAALVAKPERAASGYDTPDLSSPENLAFGTAATDSAHYSELLWRLVGENAGEYAKRAGWDGDYVRAWDEDLRVRDSARNRPAERVAASDPLHYLMPSRDGHQTSTVAPHWRVQFGTHQGVTPLTMYVDTLLALRDCEQVADVSAELVWGQGHALVETSGNAIANLIGWIEGCVAAEA